MHKLVILTKMLKLSTGDHYNVNETDFGKM